MSFPELLLSLLGLAIILVDDIEDVLSLFFDLIKFVVVIS